MFGAGVVLRTGELRENEGPGQAAVLAAVRVRDDLTGQEDGGQHAHRSPVFAVETRHCRAAWGRRGPGQWDTLGKRVSERSGVSRPRAWGQKMRPVGDLVCLAPVQRARECIGLV